MSLAEAKQCERCGATFTREGKQSNPTWASRRFCSSSCSSKRSRYGADPHVIGRRTLVAASCTSCHRLLQAVSFDFDPRKGVRRRICNGCKKATKLAKPGNAERYRILDQKYQRKQQERTLPLADRWGYVWTGPELETIARTDLSVTEMATMLRRTYKAVATMRRKIRADPRKARLAGLPKIHPAETVDKSQRRAVRLPT